MFIINLAIAIAIDIAFWSIGWVLGLSGIIAIIGFILAYAISEDAALSPWDFFRNSDWGIFCKKLGWAWVIGIITYTISYLGLSFLTGIDVLGILN